MKNPFHKENNTAALITYVALGAIAAGTISYLYFKKRAALKRIKEDAKAHAGDYLKHTPHKKKRTTDVHDLGKIVPSNS